MLSHIADAGEHRSFMESLHNSLLVWFDVNKRDLPWRHTHDAYAIWVSEIMLQQTQVATVIPYFERWIARFPTVESLAAASEADVLTLWQGLGYYRRARSLLAGAKYLSDRACPHAQSADFRWQEVPGVGPYTAGAISSIAYGQPAPLVDGNVERVFARLTGCEAAGPRLNKAAWQWAAKVVHPTRPGDWNQALMELGATVCKPVDPLCAQCPVSGQCEAYRTGRQSELPIPKPKKLTVALTHHVWVPTHGTSFGVRQVPKGEWWEGMWEFPRTATLAELETLIPNAWPEQIGRFRHSVTHHRIEVKVALVRLAEPNPELTWVEEEHLHTYALPSPQRKAFEMVGEFLGKGMQRAIEV